ncbi:DUF3037 domain-containing protein [Paraliomyxa miuraensis]|uniref:DUF3037 domain-containing protein n=1 Tax=Paraliomyxa miuraensis TaxID=376150 RepID=UPI00225704DA|nr:DUF3037 domain-containing protein [Paraliomyxa miuraensis]MCX4244497.1 DUF3037 domain-containing protein [Paraliomyxa miuraensis]
MPEHAYDYAVLRAVPRVERGERINVGVVLSCPTLGFLDCATGLDRERLRALDPSADVEAIERQLRAIEAVCRGRRGAGPIAALPRSERFHWLVSPRSTMLQASSVHAGRCADPARTLAALFDALVAPQHAR